MRGDLAFLQHAPLTAAQIAKMRESLDGLPPLPKMAGRLDAERFAYLHIILDYSLQGRGSLLELERGAEFEELNGSKELKRSIQALRRHSAGARN